MAKKEATAANETESKEVATTAANVPATLADDMMDMIAADAGAGQDFEADDLTIPRFGIIQSLSPQRKKQDANYIEGAEEGQFFNNLSKRLYAGDEGLIVIPVQFQKSFLEWGKDRGKNKGPVKNHGKDSTAFDAATTNDKGKKETAEGNIIQPTAEYFVFVVDPVTGEVSPGVMSMASVFLKQAKRWNSMINQIRVKNPKTGASIEPPIFYMAYKFTTVPESNDNGSWFRQEIAPYKNIFELPDGKALYERAKAFRESIMKGAVKVAAPEDDGSHVGAAAESDEDPM